MANFVDALQIAQYEKMSPPELRGRMIYKRLTTWNDYVMRECCGDSEHDDETAYSCRWVIDVEQLHWTRDQIKRLADDFLI